KGDGPPGATVLWRGLQRLGDITEMYRIMAPPSLPTFVGKD
ncbi:MAG: Transposase Tn5 dimerization domain, partial [Chthonomonadaceae bacterium]|nr:Transposase Tn5 dimerization domain [Chthonomonadaceae bacterium]